MDSLGDSLVIWLLNNWKWLTAIALAVGIFFAGYSFGADSVQRKWERERLETVRALLAASQVNQAAIAQLQETKNVNLATIDDLRRKLAGNRVRVPTCPETPTPSGSETQTPGTGELPTTVQGSFDNFTVGVGELMYEADTLTESCRVLRDWAASLENK